MNDVIVTPEEYDAENQVQLSSLPRSAMFMRRLAVWGLGVEAVAKLVV